MAGSAFGPRLQAAIVTLTARNRISRRDLPELARELFGIRLSVGAVDAICRRSAIALAEPHEALVASVLRSAAVNVDETGWVTAGKERTLGPRPRQAAIFRVAADRRRNQLQNSSASGSPASAAPTAGGPTTTSAPRAAKRAGATSSKTSASTPKDCPPRSSSASTGRELTSRLVQTWHGYREHQDRARLANEIAPPQTDLRALVEEAGRKTPKNKYHRGFANNLLKIWPALWTFVTHEGVEPTNNAAERSLRGPVIHRKLSHGTRTDDGERFIERALSASVTCRLQKRSLFAYLADLLTAHARRRTTPPSPEPGELNNYHFGPQDLADV